MSLSDCIKKAGKALDQKDRTAIEGAVREGMSETDAIVARVGMIDKELEVIAGAAKEKGAKVVDAPVMEDQRGEIEFLPGKTVIRLSEASDPTTFLHEAAHMFTNMEAKFAEKVGTTAQQQALLTSVNAESFADLTVDQHEMIAEGFESYLMTGKAPSIELQSAFRTYRVWFLDTYKAEENLPALTPAMREVYDRWLATDDAIATVQVSPEYQELFRSKEQAGMTDAQWAKMQKTTKERKVKAESSLFEKLVKQLERQKSKEWRDERAEIALNEKSRLEDTKLYKMLAGVKGNPIDVNEVKGYLNADAKTMRKLKDYTAPDGEPLEVMSEISDYQDIDDFLNTLIATPPIDKAATNAAQEIMVMKYGDILNDGSIRAEAQVAMANIQHEKLLLSELARLNKSSAAKDRLVLESEAERIIRRMTYSEIKPGKFLTQERRAAVKAATAKSDEVRARARRQQLVNHFLYKKALKAKEDYVRYKKHVEHVNRVEYDTNKVDSEYIQALKVTAKMYTSAKKNTEQYVAQAVAFFNSNTGSETNMSLLSDLQLLGYYGLKEQGRESEFKFRVFEELTVEEMQGVYQTLKTLRFVGGELKKTEHVKHKVRMRALIDSAVKHREPGAVKDVRDPSDDVKDVGRSYVNSLNSLRNIIRALDGGDERGAAFREIYLRIEDGNNAKLQQGREMHDRWEAVMAELGDISMSNRKGSKVTLAKEKGGKWTLHEEARVMLGLYWGNDYARTAIREGHGVTDADVEAMLSTLSKDNLAMINKMWALDEEMWAPSVEAHRKRYGVVPPKVEATPFIINGVRMTGGHTKIYYDTTYKELAEESTRNAGHTLGPAGAMISRIGSGGRKVALNRDNLSRNINETVHKNAFLNISREVSMIVNDKNYKNEIVGRHGQAFYENMVTTIQNVTVGQQAYDQQQWLHKVSKVVRRAATYKYLFYSVRNAVQQTTVLPLVTQEVGAVPFAQAAADIASDSSVRESIESMSPFMHNRAQVVNREATEILHQLEVKGDVTGQTLAAYKKYGFWMQTQIDSAFAFPAWWAKYQAEMAAHGDQRTAISAADTVVAETVGSGSDLHLSSAFQSTNTELVKAVTQFGSWFNAYYQRVERARVRGNKAELFMAVAVQPLILGVMAAALTMDLPEEDETTAEWAAKSTVSHLAAMFPFIRDMVSVALGYRNSGILQTAASGPATLSQEIADVFDDEDRTTPLRSARTALGAISSVVPLGGSGQVMRIMDFIDSDAQGKEESEWWYYQMLVKGRSR